MAGSWAPTAAGMHRPTSPLIADGPGCSGRRRAQHATAIGAPPRLRLRACVGQHGDMRWVTLNTWGCAAIGTVGWTGSAPAFERFRPTS